MTDSSIINNLQFIYTCMNLRGMRKFRLLIIAIMANEGSGLNII